MGWNKVIIGNRIKDLREGRSLTQAEVATALGVKRETVNQWESGTRDLKTDYTVKLADFFHTTCDYILRGVQSENVDVNRQLGLSDETIEILKHLYETQRTLKNGDVSPLRIINFLIEQMSGMNLFGMVKRYFACEYESIFTEDYAEVLKTNMIDVLYASPKGRDNIYVRDKHTKEITAISAGILPDIYLINIQRLLTRLKEVYRQEVAESGKHNQADE